MNRTALHRSRRAAIAFLAVVGLCGGTSADNAAKDEADGNGTWPSQLECAFERGQSWAVEDGKFKSSEPAQLTFTISNMNLDAQTASLAADGKGATALRVIRALNANHFLEVANEGFLNLTTIYDIDTKLGGYPAVHSRHFGILGDPVFAQYTGVCKTPG